MQVLNVEKTFKFRVSSPELFSTDMMRFNEFINPFRFPYNILFDLNNNQIYNKYMYSFYFCNFYFLQSVFFIFVVDKRYEK